MSTIFSNLLIHETSPYLLQHAHNPVNWHPWGPTALKKAKDENKIILVSIGYSACHWCHVMEKESFEDDSTAELMNEYFVNIKIDREERPDIDHIYMDAVQAMTGSGGWPLNVFLTPDAKPFYGGTYFPPQRAFNRSSWKEVLHGVQQAWAERKEEVISQAENLTEHIGKSIVLSPVAGPEKFSVNDCQIMFTNIMKNADRGWGGFGQAPKFPQTFTIQFLMEYFYFNNDKTALDQALLSIDKMLQGGIYDHVGGGLARYSTDTEWLAPHFEKMLYDNALFVLVLCDAYQLTKSKVYENGIRKTLDFILNKMTDASGGFYAALDADSEGEEGRYYVWTKMEIEQVLQEDAALFCKLFDVTEHGNWEGKNILRLLIPINVHAKEEGIDENDLTQKMDECIKKLHSVRNKRIRPGLDDKIILAWNALMNKAFTKASIVVGNNNYKRIAERNMQFLLSQFSSDNGADLFHTFKNGVAKYPAFLDDYAILIDALIDLYECTFQEQYLHTAFDLTKHVCNAFSDEEDVCFYYTSIHQQDVIVRKKEIYDGALPSGNAVMAKNLYKLGTTFHHLQWQDRSINMLQSIYSLAIKYPSSFAVWATAIEQHTYGINEIAFEGVGATENAERFNAGNFLPNKIIVASNNINNNIPFFRNNSPAEVLNIYLCKSRVCLPPLKDEAELLAAIVSNKF